MKLNCSCCGIRYSGEQSSEHDKGYGLCPKCFEEDLEYRIKETDKIIDIFAKALSWGRRCDFLARPREEQVYIVNEAIKAGIVQYEIGKN